MAKASLCLGADAEACLLSLRNPMLRWIALCLAFASIQAQAPRPSTSTKMVKRAGSGDPIFRLGVPKHFHGYLIEKRTNRIAQIFDGTWQKAPEVQGGDPKGEWSSQGAVLRDLDEPASNQVRVLSFNLGRRGDQWLVRCFEWEKFVLGYKAATVTDEGTGTQQGGRFSFDLDRYRLEFWSADRPWAAKEVRVFRFIGTELVPAAKLVSYIDYSGSAGASQVTPLWAAGSYVVLQDDRLGRVIYRGFGEEGRYWVVRYAREGGQVFQEAVGFFEGAQHAKGNGEFAALYANGMADFKNEVCGASIFTLQPVFQDPLRLQEVRFSGVGWSVRETPSLSSTLYGKVTEADLTPTTKEEILSRAADPNWMGSGGPYSLRSLLNQAFQGYVVQPPVPSMNPEESPTAKGANDRVTKVYLVKSAKWNAYIREVGAERVPFMIRQKPYPLGMVLTHEEVEAARAARSR